MADATDSTFAERLEERYDHRFERIEDKLGIVTNHGDRLVIVEAGVSNFNKFRLDATSKLGFVYGATWFAGVAGVILLAIFGWALSEIMPVAKVIMDDYYAHHPAATIHYEQKPHSENRYPVLANHNPQVGQIPTLNRR